MRAGLQVSVCNGYDLCHPGTQTDSILTSLSSCMHRHTKKPLSRHKN